jgi:hypothetical protein
MDIGVSLVVTCSGCAGGAVWLEEHDPGRGVGAAAPKRESRWLVPARRAGHLGEWGPTGICHGQPDDVAYNRYTWYASSQT